MSAAPPSLPCAPTRQSTRPSSPPAGRLERICASPRMRVRLRRRVPARVPVLIVPMSMHVPMPIHPRARAHSQIRMPIHHHSIQHPTPRSPPPQADTSSAKPQSRAHIQPHTPRLRQRNPDDIRPQHPYRAAHAQPREPAPRRPLETLPNPLLARSLEEQLFRNPPLVRCELVRLGRAEGHGRQGPADGWVAQLAPVNLWVEQKVVNDVRVDQVERVAAGGLRVRVRTPLSTHVGRGDFTAPLGHRRPDTPREIQQALLTPFQRDNPPRQVSQRRPARQRSLHATLLTPSCPLLSTPLPSALPPPCPRVARPPRAPARASAP